MHRPFASHARDMLKIARLASLCLTAALPAAAGAQVIRGTVSSTVGAGRVAGAVVLLLDSGLTTYARALTSDSGTFSIGVGAPGRFHLKVMRIGFRPTESRIFALTADTTVHLELTDIPVVLPRVTTRDRNDCRLHPDSSDIAALTFALWEEARTALLATAITLEQRDYRFAKLQHLRVYDMREHALRDIALREIETHGSTPWNSLPAETLRAKGYATEDDSGMTFFARASTSSSLRTSSRRIAFASLAPNRRRPRRERSDSISSPPAGPAMSRSAEPSGSTRDRRSCGASISHS